MNPLHSIIKLLKRYLSVPRTILLLAGAELILYLLTGSFILIFNIYMRKLGYIDEQIANFNSYRFLGIMLLGFPFGIYIKGRRLKPYFLLAALLLPISSIVLINAAADGSIQLISASSLFWGLGMMLLHVCSLPFIMRVAPEDTLSESISLNLLQYFTISSSDSFKTEIKASSCSGKTVRGSSNN